MLAAIAGNADGADDVSFNHKRDTAFDRNRSFHGKHSQSSVAGRKAVLEDFRRPLEESRRLGFLD